MGAGPANDDFDDWYRCSFERIVRTLAVAVGDLDVAVDAVAEAFCRALGKREAVVAMPNRDGWVYRTALNVVRRRQRRQVIEERLLRRHGQRHVSEPSVPDPQVWDAVRRLPDRQREAVALRYVGGLSELEVAAAMGIAEGTASATLNAARRRLAQTLGQEES